MLSKRGQVDDDSDSGSDGEVNDGQQIKLKQRGRPKLAQITEILVDWQVYDAGNDFSFGKQCDIGCTDQNAIQMLEAEECYLTYKNSIYRLNYEQGAAKELLKNYGLDGLEISQLMAMYRGQKTDRQTILDFIGKRNHKSKHKKRDMGAAFEPQSKARKQRAVKIAKVLYLASQNQFSQATIASKLMVTPTYVSRVLTQMKKNPQNLQKKMMAKTFTELPTPDAVTEMYSQMQKEGHLVLANKGELIQWLRSQLVIPENLTDRELMNLAKMYWGIKKKTAKLEKPLRESELVLEGKLAYDKFLIGRFAMDPTVLIVDVSTFSLDHRGVKGWAPPRTRPTVPHAKGNRHYHLILAINRDGIKAACLTNRSVTMQDTAFFIVSLLEKISKVSVIMLDNGPANSPKVLAKVGHLYNIDLVYNVANNPGIILLSMYSEC